MILYMPCVIKADGLFKMWYVGSSDHARAPAFIHLGYAESADGLRWEEYPANPIVTDDAIPWGHRFQTPHVLYDLQDRIYKMWFTAVDESGRGGCTVFEPACRIRRESRTGSRGPSTRSRY